MKYLLFLVSIVIALVLYFTLGKDEVSYDNLENDSTTKAENRIEVGEDSKALNKNEILVSNSLTPQDIRNERAKYPNGIKVTSLDKSRLSDQNKAILKQKFDNLHKYGSFNENKLSGEFRHVKKYKRNINKDYPLSFTPTKNKFLEENFNLTGKYASGAYSKGVGFNSYTRLFENKKKLQTIELTEMYLNPKNYSLIEVYEESFNKKIGGLDLTFQEIPIGNTTAFTIDFFNNQKMYSLSTMRVPKKDVEDLVYSLIEESNKFTN